MRAGVWATVFVLALGASPALARDRAELLRRCDLTERVDRVQRIVSCTALIELGGETEQRLAVLYYYRGLAHHWNWESDKAIADFTEAIRLNPWFPDAHRWRGHKYVHAQTPDYDRALADFSAMIRLDSSNGKAFFLRGTVYMKISRYEAAVREFDEAIRLDPSDWQAFEERSNALEKLGQRERSKQDREHAFSISPSWQTYACMLAKDLEKALPYCNRALSLNPDFHRALVWRGRWYLRSDKLDAAMMDFDRALRIEPEEVFVRTTRGITRLRMGQLDAAINDFDIVLRDNDPANYTPRAVALYARGVALQRKGDAPGGAADIAAAKAESANIEEIAAGYGLK